MMKTNFLNNLEPFLVIELKSHHAQNLIGGGFQDRTHQLLNQLQTYFDQAASYMKKHPDQVYLSGIIFFGLTTCAFACLWRSVSNRCEKQVGVCKVHTESIELYRTKLCNGAFPNVYIDESGNVVKGKIPPDEEANMRNGAGIIKNIVSSDTIKQASASLFSMLKDIGSNIKGRCKNVAKEFDEQIIAPLRRAENHNNNYNPSHLSHEEQSSSYPNLNYEQSNSYYGKFLENDPGYYQ